MRLAPVFAPRRFEQDALDPCAEKNVAMALTYDTAPIPRPAMLFSKYERA